MPDNDEIKTGRSIRTIQIGHQYMVGVMGVTELYGLDGNDVVETTYQIGDDGHYLLLSVTATKIGEQIPRVFDVYFSKNHHAFALKRMSHGARIIFTSAPSTFTTHTVSSIPYTDFLAVITEYGGCYVDLDPGHVLQIKQVFGV